jgi:GMP synthase-like glutamine amidotransferase
MRLLVFQHIDCEHPGSLRQFLAKDGVEWDAVELDAGETISELEGYDALWVMGGPMDVWDIEENPWLIAEKAAIRKWVGEFKRPYLGLCLGHQLLADAMGGTCGPQRPSEIGIMDVELTAAGKVDPIFKDMPTKQKCLQWHSVRVAQEPENTTILASSEACRVQAMRVGDNAWSMQFHVEIEPDTVDNWGAIPAYSDALMATIGQAGFDEMQAASANNIDAFLASAEQLYTNFMTQARG